jgi:hypothetical protein
MRPWLSLSTRTWQTLSVFLWQDAVWRPLDPPYGGPYKVLSRTKTMQIAINARPVTVSTDRVKPAYIMVETDGCTVTARPPPEQTTQPAPQLSPPATQTTSSSRHIRIPARFNMLALFSARG